MAHARSGSSPRLADLVDSHALLALHDQQAERQEEAADLGFQPCTTRHRRLQMAAEACPHLGAHQPIEQQVEQMFAGRQPSSRDALQANIQRSAEQHLLPRRLAPHLRQNAAADHLQHAWHRGEDRRADRHHVGGQMLNAAAIDDFSAEAREKERADGVR